MVDENSNVREDDKKKHRPRKSGRKSLKKNKSRDDAQLNNPKAFAVQHTTKASRMVQRTLDHQTKKHRLPQSRYTPDIPPPYVVALVGPPGCGKSTLLHSLIKHFARQAVSVVKGPVTVVVGKKTRFTFIECGCDINSMLDAAKIADIVLLLVNVRVGLEMYHFEFINMVQVHGMPRVIPILNHLDTFKDSSSSRSLRRKIKQRLWTDLNSKIFLLSRFQPKKYMSKNLSLHESGAGEYLLAEVRRLARLIMVKTPRPTDWRASHPYLLIDRLEDITDDKILSNDPSSDRCVSLYGYVRGAPLPPALTAPGIHIAGLGDFALSDCTRQLDPCPLPSQTSQLDNTEAVKQSRHLSEREKKIYAPMSSLGGVLFDRDATYIDLGGSHYLTNHKSRGSNSTKVVTQAALDVVHAAFNEETGLDEKLETEHQIRMMDDAPYLLASNVKQDFDDQSSSSESSSQTDETMEEEQLSSNVKKELNTDINMFSNEPFAGFLIPAGTQLNEPEQKINIKSSKPESAHLKVKQLLDDIEWKSTFSSRINWNRLIYGSSKEKFQESNSNREKLDYSTAGEHDFTMGPITIKISDSKWEDPVLQSKIVSRFTTGQWNENEDAQTLLDKDLEARKNMTMLETQTHALASASHIQYSSNGLMKSKDSNSDYNQTESEEYDDDNEFANDDDDENNEDIFRDSISEDEADEIASLGKGSDNKDPLAEFDKNLLRPTKRQKLLEKRQRHKALFNQLYEAAGGGREATAFYDKLVASRESQQSLNREVLKSLPEEVVSRLEGFPPGSYVRIEIRGVPYQFISRFDPSQPLVAGGLSAAEETFGHIQLRFRTHRWLKRVLRSNDPLTVSIGWRRYQTICIFSKEEHNLRRRFLKYSLPHEHCLATIYGPLVAPKTGVIAFVNSAWRSLDSSDDKSLLPSFRVAGLGSVLDSNKSFQIMKKLKLIGEPFKIFSKTAFIRGMFNSPLEVSKMIGARIQTVSKIRGIIKAALTNSSTSKPGDFRATFEAQIRKADLVFLRTFVAMELPNYYNPILNRLIPIEGESDNKPNWRLLRTLSELRYEAGIKPVNHPDSQYKPIHRPVYVPAPLRVPTKLIAALPYAHKPKPSRKAMLAQSGGDSIKTALSTELPTPVRSAEEMENESRQDLLTRLRYLHSEYINRQREKMRNRVSKYQKQCAKQAQIRTANERKRRKEYFSHKSGKSKRQKFN